MKQTALILAALALLSGCGASVNSGSLPPVPTAISSPAPEQPLPDLSAPQNDRSEEESGMTLLVQIGEYTFTALWEDNAAARTLADWAAEGPVTVSLRDYGGFEKVGSLKESLPAEDRQFTTGAGDIMLYNGDQIVLFYGSNSWSYTPLGHVEDLTGWQEALSGGEVTVTFSVPE